MEQACHVISIHVLVLLEYVKDTLVIDLYSAKIFVLQQYSPTVLVLFRGTSRILGAIWLQICEERKFQSSGAMAGVIWTRETQVADHAAAKCAVDGCVRDDGCIVKVSDAFEI